MCCHKESNDSILIAAAVMVKKASPALAFFRPRVLPDDGCEKDGVARKWRSLRWLTDFFRTMWFRFRRAGFVKEQQESDQDGTIP
nr:hypothetical protein [uncultured Duganella sp.]